MFSIDILHSFIKKNYHFNLNFFELRVLLISVNRVFDTSKYTKYTKMITKCKKSKLV